MTESPKTKLHINLDKKMYAYTGCDEPYVEPRDFEDAYYD